MSRRRQTLGISAPAFSRLSFFNFLSLPRISHRKARPLSGPLVRRLRQLQCRRRRIVPLVADDLEATSGNRLSCRTFAQVIYIIPLSCRLFSAASSNLARGGRRLVRTSCAGDYSSRSFSQVGWAAGVYRRQPCSRGGANRVPSPVPAGTRVPGAFRASGNNRRRRWERELVQEAALDFIIEWE